MNNAARQRRHLDFVRTMPVVGVRSRGIVGNCWMSLSYAESKHLMSERSPPMPGESAHISYLDGSVIMPHAPPPF